MIYLFSSKPKTVETYLQSKNTAFQLVTKETFRDFVETYVVNADDLGIVYDFGKMIPESLLSKLLLLNIHFSLLPKYRGAIPVEAAIINGESKTGISVQKMVKEMDAGPLLYSKEVVINPDWTSGELQSYMDSLLPDLLSEIKVGQKKEYEFTSQVGEPSYCYIKELSRAVAEIDWRNDSSVKMVNKIRAYNPEPLAWVKIVKSGQEKTVNILRAEVVVDINIASGEYLFIKKRGLALGTKNGTVLVTELVVEGSKLLAAGDIVSLKGSVTL
jgi:methionyl-tRNA formyltransferase